MADTMRRLTLADAYRDAQHTIDQLTTRTSGEPSATVEITRNAKGEPQFSVKVYANASADPAAVRHATENAYDQAVSAFDALAALLPYAPPTMKSELERETRRAAAAGKVAK